MRILAVDDKEIPRQVLEKAIRKAAPTAELAVCASAAEALAVPDVASVDVAFLDIDMAGVSGIELARRLKRLNPRINVVFATGYGEYMADAFALHSSGYLMKPITAADVADELDNLRFPLRTRTAPGRLFMRCFGDFEVFAQDRPVVFGRAKSKELLAYLVDRRGAMVGLREAEAALWEEQPGSRLSGSYLRVLVADLRKSLETCGHANILVKRYGQVGLDTSQFDCDYYDFLRSDPAAIRDWRGEYMEQYAWAESTKAALLNS